MSRGGKPLASCCCLLLQSHSHLLNPLYSTALTIVPKQHSHLPPHTPSIQVEEREEGQGKPNEDLVSVIRCREEGCLQTVGMKRGKNYIFGMSQARWGSSLGASPWGPSVIQHRQAAELAADKIFGVQQLCLSSSVRNASLFSRSAFPDPIRHRAMNCRRI